MSTYPVAHIDLAALSHNLNRVKQLAPNSRIMSVIKANAYGHGAIEAAKALAESDAFAVARLQEAIQLREAGIEKTIVILEGIHSREELSAASKHQLSLVFHYQSQLDLLSDTSLTQPIEPCWLMLETGMHRLGFNPEQAEIAYEFLTQHQAIAGSIGVMSHFACADEVGHQQNQLQLTLTQDFASKHGCEVSLANSAAIFSLPDSHQDWVRPGLMLYGLSPFADQSAEALGLKAVITFCSRIIAVQTLKTDDHVGYGASWSADKNSRIAIVDAGYADGYNRLLSNNGTVLIQQQLCKVVGRVSMDMIAVDVTELEMVKVGDEVLLWGGEALPTEQVAMQLDTISYELVCQINQRVKREYHHG